MTVVTPPGTMVASQLLWCPMVMPRFAERVTERCALPPILPPTVVDTPGVTETPPVPDSPPPTPCEPAEAFTLGVTEILGVAEMLGVMERVTSLPPPTVKLVMATWQPTW